MPEKRKRTWERRADECRKKHRPKLRDWARDGFGSRRSADFVALKEKYSHDSCIQRFSYNQLSVSEFIDQYEKKSIPCIIADIPREENWKAAWAWDWHKFRHLRRRYFKVGEDDDGYSVKMRLKHYLNYRKRTKDDSPLYIFDKDLFSLVGEKRRPPYRWFLVGPARSGTTVHIDPLGTSAWNTVLKGCKLWVLFPPGVAKRVVKGLDVIAKGEDDEAVNYFVDLIPRMRRKYPDLDMRLFLQYEGETVFVPGGWWHAVINLEDSIAVTQNYCSHANFERVWIRTKKGRKKMSVKWRRLLGQHHPDLARLADFWDSVNTDAKENTPVENGRCDNESDEKKKIRMM